MYSTGAMSVGAKAVNANVPKSISRLEALRSLTVTASERAEALVSRLADMKAGLVGESPENTLSRASGYAMSEHGGGSLGLLTSDVHRLLAALDRCDTIISELAELVS